MISLLHDDGTPDLYDKQKEEYRKIQGARIAKDINQERKNGAHGINNKLVSIAQQITRQTLQGKK